MAVQSVVGLRIRKLRLEKGLTQKELGRVLNVNKSAISHYEKGQRSIPIDTIIKMANYFKVEITYILGINNVVLTPSISSFRMSDEEITFIIEMRKLQNYGSLIINPKKYAKLIDIKTSGYNPKI